MFHPPFFHSQFRLNQLVHIAFLVASLIDHIRPLLRALLPTSLYTMVLALVRGKLMGLAYFRLSKGQSTPAELGIGILEEHQGKGIGSKLLSTLLSAAREVGVDTIRLTVSVNNDKAIALYEKYGFVITGMTSGGNAWNRKTFDVFEMELVLNST